MRKIISTVLFILAVAVAGWSQDMSPNAIGLKFGPWVGSHSNSGVTISYQKALSDINRAEVNLGISSGTGYSQFNVGGFYQWVHNIQDGWNWYIGPGASLGSLNIKNSDSYVYLGVAGQLGLEYRFDFPLQLTLDVNPYIGLLNDEGFAMPILLGVRYTF